MTREEFEAKWQGMTPKERDAWVAEDVIGFKLGKTPPDCNGEYGGEDILLPDWVDDSFVYPPKGRIGKTFFVSNYTEDFPSAWNVLMEMEKEHWSFNSKMASKTQWECKFGGKGWAKASSLPEAICKAALIAKVVEP